MSNTNSPLTQAVFFWISAWEISGVTEAPSESSLGAATRISSRGQTTCSLPDPTSFTTDIAGAYPDSAEPDLSASGVIGLNAGLKLKYDNKVFNASAEEIPVEGTGVGWEKFVPSLWRITLSSTNSPAKGSFTITIR